MYERDLPLSWEVQGKKVNTLFKDFKTGMTFFAVHTENEDIPLDPKYNSVLCKGYITDLPDGIPIELKGTYVNGVKPFFLVEDISITAKNDSIALQFLKENDFTGIGDKTSVEILEIVNGDIFAFCKKEDALEKLCSIRGLSRGNAIDFIHKINKYSEIQEIAEYIVSYGGTFESSELIFQMYEENTLKEIKSNPYILTYTGVDFTVCEKIAKENNISQISNKRVSALVYKALGSVESQGNTCCLVSTLLSQCHVIEDKSGVFSNTSNISLMSYIYNNKNEFVFYRMNGDVYLYRKKTFDLEQKSARHIVRLDNSKEKYPFEDVDIESIEKELNIKYGEEQLNSFNILKSSGVKILTGGPGRGKSTVVNGLILAYKQMFPNREISLCAPTGTAAKKLETITGDKAFTVHKLLDVKPFMKDEFIFKNENDPLTSDFIIIDESSMVDIRLFMMILSASKSGALVLFVGDENQLASVGSGNVLRDMINSGHFETYKLSKVYRQAENSTIILNADKINTGICDLLSDDTFEIHLANGEEMLKGLALDLAMGAKENFKDIKVYTPVKKKEYSYSTYNLNVDMHDVFGDSSGNYLIYDDVYFYEGDPIVMNKNNYEIGYMNGEEGKILSISQKNGKYVVEIEKKSDGDIFQISNSKLQDMDLGYSMTIHKSQGGECDLAIIIVPTRPYTLMERSLLYVAVTRARKKAIIVTEGDALENAILRNKSNTRVTGLNSQINTLTNKYRSILGGVSA